MATRVSRSAAFALLAGLACGAAGCGDDEQPAAQPIDRAPTNAPAEVRESDATDAADTHDARESQRARRPAETDDAEPPSKATTEAPEPPESARALADLILASFQDRPTGPYDMAEVMRAFNELDDAAVPELIRLMRIRETGPWACMCIGQRRTTDPAAIAALVARLRADAGAPDAEFSAVRDASFALSRLGAPGLEAIRGLLTDRNDAIVFAGLDALSSTESWPPDLAPAVLAAAARPSAEVRQAATVAMYHAPAGDAATGAALLALAFDADESVRRAAIDVMGNRPAEFAPNAESLVRLAEEHAAEERPLYLVVYVLCGAGPEPTLLALASSVAAVRAMAANYADAEDPAVQSRLVELLGADVDVDVRSAALRALSACAEPPLQARDAALDLLRGAAADTDRAAAAAIVGALLAKGAVGVDPLLTALSDRSRDVCGAAALALAENCPPADRVRVLDALRPVWTGETVPDSVRLDLAGAVGALEGPGTPAVEFLADGVKRSPQRAFAGLARVGTREAVTELLSWLDTVRWDERMLAVTALGDVTAGDERIVPALLAELRSAPRTGVRAVAAGALARHREAPAVRQALEEAAAARWPDVARAARAALGRSQD